LVPKFVERLHSASGIHIVPGGNFAQELVGVGGQLRLALHREEKSSEAQHAHRHAPLEMVFESHCVELFHMKVSYLKNDYSCTANRHALPEFIAKIANADALQK
jgi:hypothetical protein